MTSGTHIAIIGGGNLGSAIARGLVQLGTTSADALTITRRSPAGIEALRQQGYSAISDNLEAVRHASLVVVAVRPTQMDTVLAELTPGLNPKQHTVISTASDVRIEDIRRHLGDEIPVLRAMPNVAVAAGASMTCLACEPTTPADARAAAAALFETLGHVEFIEEAQMTPATALCACGVAFFLRAIRAASQGGVQVGFHADEAIRLAAQTAKGAAELVLAKSTHPESLIDTVTTPLGITIAGLNEMEHQGFSSSLIRGIVLSAEKANELYASRQSSEPVDD